MNETPQTPVGNTAEASKLLSYEEYNEKVKTLKTVDDVHNFLRDLVAPTLQTML